MAIAYASRGATASGASSGSPPSTGHIAITANAGDTIVLVACVSGTAPNTVTDSAGNSYTHVASMSDLDLYICLNSNSSVSWIQLAGSGAFGYSISIDTYTGITGLNLSNTTSGSANGYNLTLTLSAMAGSSWMVAGFGFTADTASTLSATIGNLRKYLNPTASIYGVACIDNTSDSIKIASSFQFSPLCGLAVEVLGGNTQSFTAACSSFTATLKRLTNFKSKLISVSASFAATNARRTKVYPQLAAASSAYSASLKKLTAFKSALLAVSSAASARIHKLSKFASGLAASSSGLAGIIASAHTIVKALTAASTALTATIYKLVKLNSPLISTSHSFAATFKKCARFASGLISASSALVGSVSTLLAKLYTQSLTATSSAFSGALNRLTRLASKFFAAASTALTATIYKLVKLNSPLISTSHSFAATFKKCARFASGLISASSGFAGLLSAAISGFYTQSFAAASSACSGILRKFTAFGFAASSSGFAAKIASAIRGVTAKALSAALAGWAALLSFLHIPAGQIVPGAKPTGINLNSTDPAVAAADGAVLWQASAPYPDPNNPVLEVRDVSAYVAPFTGDSGSGGVAGAVPKPEAGDAAANKVLSAGGAWTEQSQGDKGGLRYGFDTTISAGTSGNGDLRFNNATIGSVTAIYLDYHDMKGVDLHAFVDHWADSTSTIKGYVLIKENSNAGTPFSIFSVSAIVDHSTYTEVDVAYVAGTAPTNGNALVVEWIRTGDKGATGARGGGAVSTQSTPSRSLGSVYHNTGSGPLYISIGCYGNTAGHNLLAVSDSNSTPTQHVAFNYCATTNEYDLFFIVLPGNYYKVYYDSGAGGTIDYWVEWS